MEAPSAGRSFLYDVVLPKVEALSWLAAILGFLAQWNQLGAGAFLLMLGLGTLSLVYFLRAYAPASHVRPDSAAYDPSAAYNDFPEPIERPSFLLDGLAPKLTGISGAVVLLGILFKLLVWPGSRVMLLVGSATLLLVVVLSALRQRLNWRALLLTALGGLMLYVPSETLIRQFYRHDPALTEKMIYQLRHSRDRAAGEAVRQRVSPRRANP